MPINSNRVLDQLRAPAIVAGIVGLFLGLVALKMFITGGGLGGPIALAVISGIGFTSIGLLAISALLIGLCIYNDWKGQQTPKPPAAVSINPPSITKTPETQALVARQQMSINSQPVTEAVDSKAADSAPEKPIDHAMALAQCR